MIPSTSTLGEIATDHPAATRVFLRHKLDFCCGGKRSLARACKTAGLDPATITSEIIAEGQSDDQPVHWETKSAQELADHIESYYHEGLRRDLPPLIEAALRVERVHADKSNVPKGLADLLSSFWAEMQNHMAKEETILFPMIRRGTRGPNVHMPVRAMMSEHDDHGARLSAIRQLTDDLLVPSNACGTWRALYEGLEKMEADLMQHIHLENDILFKRAVQTS